MDTRRRSPYLVLFIIFSVLSSIFGLYYLSLISKPKTTSPLSSDQPAVAQPTVEEIAPTDSPAPDILVETTASPTTKPSPAPTPTTLSYTSPDNSFSVTYPSHRSLTVEKESTGQRYVFYSKSGNITVHVGPNWSWQHPGRTLTSDFLVAGQTTFRYDISAQTLTDFTSGDTKYTVQCVHNGQESLQTECSDFLSSLKI